VAQVTNIFDFEEARLEQVEEYILKSTVLGLEDIAKDVRVAYPTTIYNLTGDDASGVAGVLFPNGDFIAALPPRKVAAYWEFDETLAYEQVEGELNEAGTGPRVVGDSWTLGEVLWDGSVVGAVELHALDGDETDLERSIVKRRVRCDNLTGEWDTTGELWRGIESGRSMAEMAQRPGKLHLNHLQTNSSWAA
jgi:hypothetical protein